MKRDEFLATFGIGLAAVCTGACFAGCGKSSTTGAGTNGSPLAPIPPSNVSFTVNLASELTGVGESKTTNGVIVVRLATGNVASSFTAVQVACTHEGTSINYILNQAKFICPNHGSEFSNSGTVLLGPAASNLKQFSISITGSTLTVTG